MAPLCFHNPGGEPDTASRAVLGRLGAATGLAFLERAPDGERTGYEVYVLPFQAQQVALP